MAFSKYSALLTELIEYSKQLGVNDKAELTAERLIISLMHKLGVVDNVEANEELMTSKELIDKAFPDMVHARGFLMSCIHMEDAVSGADVEYMREKMLEIDDWCERDNNCLITLPHVLRYLIDDPSTSLKIAMKMDVEAPKAEPAEEETEPDDFSDIEDFIDLLEDIEVEDEPEPKDDSDKGGMASVVDEVKRIREQLKEKIFGQDNAINVFVTGYFRARMLAMTDKTRRRPKATFLFAGPPGVGKTFLAESVAEALNMKDKFRIYDMSEYCDKEAAIEFCGSDNVYKNSKGGNFTTYLEENPECIILFDEIEKAHISIIHLFLQILDAGRIRDSNTDKEISLKDAILIFTTNAGRQLYEDSDIGDLSILPRKVVLNSLRKDVNPETKTPFFPGAICSRFASGNVVMFNHVHVPDLLKIAKKEMIRHTENIRNQIGINIQIADEVYPALLFSEGGNVDARTIRSRAESLLNDELYELLRLVSASKVKSSVDSVKDVEIRVDLSNAEPEIRTLFKKENRQRLLLIASEGVTEKVQSLLPDFDVVGVQSKEEAIAAMKEAPLDVVLLDVKYGVSDSTASALNIEDVDSPAREFYKFLREQRNTLPVFLLDEGGDEISDEERDSFLKQGMRGVLVLEGDGADFADEVSTIATSLHQQVCLTKLASESKIVSFETSQTVSPDGRSATIKLFDFKLTVAIDSEDTKDVLNSVSRPNVKFDDVIGANDAKSELTYFVNYLKNPHRYTGTGVKAPRGVLLYGPPGTGKTMLAKAMASEAGVAFIAAEGNEFLKSGADGGPERVHELFRTARKYAPAILFVDEIDAIAKARTGYGEAESILTAFLTEMDGFSTNTSKPVFVLAATNFNVEPGTSKSLDPALMRRFDRRVYIDLPNREERIKFLKMKISKNQALDISDKQIDNIAMRSTGMSLAELDSVVELALRSAIREGSYVVNDAILEEAFELFNSGEKKSWDVSELERTARHESGHAFLNWMSGETPSYLTIVARGNHGGYMQHADNEGKATYTKDDLLALIRTSLGGRAAEIVFYGERDGVSTGASADLRKATGIAQEIVCAYGMDEKFGLAVVPYEAAQSGALSCEVREAVKAILDEQMKEAIRIISENKDKVDALVSELMAKNHLNGPEIEQVLRNA